ncbi:hypothetical protein SIID45300_02250 [Candidatus Magnetaquicoccaceae bacterium FCR-1]|uniref:High light inducible protein n=1 Tax=Candidatus Magnetaquiglobus chichijimensis TaxID=3141448 RepID=A0ABQ0CAJ8_9PROT
MEISEITIEVPVVYGHRQLLNHISATIQNQISSEQIPIRFVMSETNASVYKCELALLTGLQENQGAHLTSIFDFSKRAFENTDRFNAVLLVPTGIGCAIGGHAGDATPMARMLASVCDTLITHPNVVNASDMNEIPENGLYVEGSVITRLMMGTCGLLPVRANRVLVVIDEHPSPLYTWGAINSVSAARATLGISCPAVVCMDPPVLVRSIYAPSGRAVGSVEQMEGLMKILAQYKGQFDALAISTQIATPDIDPVKYYKSKGAMINPWGGVEALLTHALSSVLQLPTAHSPMFTSTFENTSLSEVNVNVLDPRMAAEVISLSFFICVLKGLMRSPKIIHSLSNAPKNVITATDISCLIIPDGCIGLPVLAALEQGIKVIAVKENQNIMRNNLKSLPWGQDQFFLVNNYWEAVGVMAAIRQGLDPFSVRRPLANTLVQNVKL